jgi:hypothetical protein
MELFILPGVHMSERSEFGPQNKKLQISCHEFIKQLMRGNNLYSVRLVKASDHPHRQSKKFVNDGMQVYEDFRLF